jgi:hypothetical protein
MVDYNMNEWELQHYLTKKWRTENLNYNGIEYQLVCWELMFPSWIINRKRNKWNEISIDFIFYSIKLSEFLCVELKNSISGKKNLLSGYCQATQRSINFIDQYDIVKLTNARRLCYSDSIKERGGKITLIDDINFSNNPVVKRVLMAQKFPLKANETIKYWNSLNRLEIRQEISKYVANREFERFNKMSEKQFDLINKNDLIIMKIGISPAQ